MDGLLQFLQTSYTPYQATENAAHLLKARGFTQLAEGESWTLTRGGRYFVTRGGSSLIAFTLDAGDGLKIVASHTDSPCFKLKEHAAFGTDFTRLNAEPYGGGVWYTFFDRPLKIAGRVVTEEDGVLTARNYVSDFNVVLPSLAVHMNREVNDKFAPNLQTELPLYALGKAETSEPVAFDLYAVCAEAPFVSGKNGEFVSAPRVDNLTSVYSSLSALSDGEHGGICVAACLDSEEIGSRTRQGAGGDFLKRTLKRILSACDLDGENARRLLGSSLLVSLDNAHSLHPNHPEKCDPTNRAVMGGGVVIKMHAGGAYTTDALTAAVIKTVLSRAGVRYQTFFNRSDQRSGSTLGAISLGQVSIPSVDLGIAQLAMHSAVETFARNDYEEMERGLSAFYASEICLSEYSATVK